MLTGDEAEFCANAWLRAQSDIPEGSYLSKPMERRATWAFWVRKNIEESDERFNLMLIIVEEDKSVRVQLDHRERYRSYDLIGFARESRVFKVMRERTQETPEWFVKLKRSTYMQNLRGVDGLIRARLDGEVFSVPMQIKSSMRRAQEFYERKPHLAEIVVTIVVWDRDTDDDIRAKVYTAADVIRQRILSGEYSLEEFRKKRQVIFTGGRR